MNKKEVFTDSKIAYTSQYDSPLGTITVACDDEAIIGLWFNGQRHFGNVLPSEIVELGENELRTLKVGCKANTLLEEARRWLDVYFSGQEPDFLPPLRYDSTPFRKAVCDIMLTIPYGKTMTYGDIADLIAGERGIEKMSAQAVGGAVGHNPISLMIPCHRVVGTNGSLTGYGGGIDRKVKILELENADMTNLFIPKKGTAVR